MPVVCHGLKRCLLLLLLLLVGGSGGERGGRRSSCLCDGLFDTGIGFPKNATRVCRLVVVGAMVAGVVLKGVQSGC
ncbi:hypothetical protein BKA57DRAFT_477950 [Linnemannia elongata]|nr:hypothetical protein BKA57DRAFT_477950 [Linnemannia elongata]